MIPRIFSRILRGHRRLYSEGNANNSATRNDAVKEKDEHVYGGLKSWDILTSERHAHGVRVQQL